MLLYRDILVDEFCSGFVERLFELPIEWWLVHPGGDLEDLQNSRDVVLIWLNFQRYYY